MPSILICNESISAGGVGTYTLNLSKSLKERGWKIHFLLTNVAGEYYNDMKLVSCHYYDMSPMSLSFKKLRAVADIVDKINPDILLLNHCSLIHYALPLISPKIKPVAVLHNDVPLFYKVATLFSQRIFRWIAPSHALATNCVHYISDEQSKRIRVIQHGINIKFFNPNNKDFSRRLKRISFIGHIGENKGADYLPEIFGLVVKRFPEVDIQIVGNGYMQAFLENQFAEKGINVTFVGYVRSERVAKILQETDILLLPSRVEGFGLIIVEAMLCGTVPVVSRLMGITDDIVEDGVTGTLVESGNVEGFANAIASLIENPEKLISMSKTAREAAVHRYSAERMLDAYEALFAEGDDRERMPRQRTFGWIAETIGEKVRNGIDRQWIVNRAKEIWK
jgi:glycosyltransferase involved in cell wall biosynthesis